MPTNKNRTLEEKNMRRNSLVGATGCLLLLVLTACSTVTHQSGEAAPAGSRGPASASAQASGASGTPGAGTSGAGVPSASVPRPNSSSSAALVPMQTPQGGEFRSPSGNITCEVNYERAGLTQAYCQTATPARSVTMNSTGGYKTCTGDQCLGDAGEGTPTLAYGQATGVGPFRCVSTSTGITCTAGGKGFRIANTGITPASS